MAYAYCPECEEGYNAPTIDELYFDNGQRCKACGAQIPTNIQFHLIRIVHEMDDRLKKLEELCPAATPTIEENPTENALTAEPQPSTESPPKAATGRPSTAKPADGDPATSPASATRPGFTNPYPASQFTFLGACIVNSVWYDLYLTAQKNPLARYGDLPGAYISGTREHPALAHALKLAKRRGLIDE